MTERPIVGDVGEEIYAATSPAFSATEDADDPEASDPFWALLVLCQALGMGFENVWDINNGGEEPWSIALDADNAPDFALPWLASMAGVRVYDSWTTDQLRQAIKDRDGQLRGSPGAMVAAIKRVLTGQKRVELQERDGDDAYHFTVRTYPDDTPNAALVSQAIIAQKPAGLQFVHLVSDAQTWAEVASTHLDYASVETDYADLNDLLLNL